MGRNFLKGTEGETANAVLAAARYNFRRLLAWLAALWRVLAIALIRPSVCRLAHRPKAGKSWCARGTGAVVSSANSFVDDRRCARMR
jgi:hypothetical protein